MSEPFQLANDPPKQRPWTPEAPPATRQTVLFAGMDCLPGQLDLFQTDGELGDGDHPALP